MYNLISMEEPNLFSGLNTNKKPAKPGKKKLRTYTVSEAAALVKVALEQGLPPRLTIMGQISSWKAHVSGHCYFSLKDAQSQLPCVMWKRGSKKLRFEPENGLEIVAVGHIDIYAPQGQVQFYVEKMTPAGVGALQLAFEQMVKKLKAEGLFKDEHKKPLPRFSERIGIVTSASGAAVGDIVDSIYNRWPAVKLFLYPVPVQGEPAAGKIAAAIADINRRNAKLQLDVLIVGRGGGSMEDLWAFNEEAVARAIYASKIPIISAVGHEVDTTIADLVADARASTPTKAGVIAVPDETEITAQLNSAYDRIEAYIKNKLLFCGQNLQTVLASSMFRNRLLPVQNAAQQIDEIETAMAGGTKSALADIRHELSRFYEQIVKIEPTRLLGQKKVELNNIFNRAKSAIQKKTHRTSLQLTAQENRLAGLNPKKILKRGYSIASNKKTGKVVMSISDVKPGDLIVTELADENLIESQVKKK